MASAKDSLRQVVEQLSEEQAQRILDLVGPLVDAPQASEARERLSERLRSEPIFIVPPPDAPPFQQFEAIEVPGPPASELLIADRR